MLIRMLAIPHQRHRMTGPRMADTATGAFDSVQLPRLSTGIAPQMNVALAHRARNVPTAIHGERGPDGWYCDAPSCGSTTSPRGPSLLRRWGTQSVGQAPVAVPISIRKWVSLSVAAPLQHKVHRTCDGQPRSARRPPTRTCIRWALLGRRGRTPTPCSNRARAQHAPGRWVIPVAYWDPFSPNQLTLSRG